MRGGRAQLLHEMQNSLALRLTQGNLKGVAVCQLEPKSLFKRGKRNRGDNEVLILPFWKTEIQCDVCIVGIW